MQADVFNTAQWRPHLQGAVGLVSSIGAFGGNDFMLKVRCAQTCKVWPATSQRRSL